LAWIAPTKKADLCLLDPATGQRRCVTIDTAPEALCEGLAELRQQQPAARVGLCLEQHAVHLIAFLEAYAWITLHPINPITLQKYREAFVTSRAKDDTKDAEFLADLLWNHHAQLPVWSPQDSPTRAVQQRVAHRRAVVDERTALCNRLIALLKPYYPQALTLCGEDLWRPLATAFLLPWPSLGAVQKAKPATVKQFYYLHGSRSQTVIAQRLTLIPKAGKGSVLGIVHLHHSPEGSLPPPVQTVIHIACRAHLQSVRQPRHRHHRLRPHWRRYCRLAQVAFRARGQWRQLRFDHAQPAAQLCHASAGGRRLTVADQQISRA